MGICDRCHEEKLVRTIKVREATVMDGAATYGTVIKHICEDCSSKKKNDKNDIPAPSAQALKNLKKSMKKLLR